MSEPINWDTVRDLEPESGVYFGATTLQAERELRARYPISWRRLVELKLREMQRLLTDVPDRVAETPPTDAYRLQRRVNALRRIAVEVDDSLLELSQELLKQAA